MVILMHLQEACKREDTRRVNERTGKPVAGYTPGKGKAFSFFYGSGKKKMQDIVKGRVRRYKRETMVTDTLIEYGAMVTDERAQLEVCDMQDNRRAWLQDE